MTNGSDESPPLRSFYLPTTKQELLDQSLVSIKVYTPKILFGDLVRDSRVTLTTTRSMEQKALLDLLDLCDAGIRDSVPGATKILFEWLTGNVFPRNRSSTGATNTFKNPAPYLSSFENSQWHSLFWQGSFFGEHNAWYSSHPDAFIEHVEDPVHITCNVSGRGIYFTAICPAIFRVEEPRKSVEINGETYYKPSRVINMPGHLRVDSCFCEFGFPSLSAIHLNPNTQPLP